MPKVVFFAGILFENIESCQKSFFAGILLENIESFENIEQSSQEPCKPIKSSNLQKACNSGRNRLGPSEQSELREPASKAQSAQAKQTKQRTQSKQSKVSKQASK